MGKSADLTVNLRAPSRPGCVRLLQRDLVEYLMRELGVSKVTALEKIKKLERNRLVTIDRTSGQRKTAVTVDIGRIVKHLEDNAGYEGFQPGDQGPLGPILEGDDEFARIVAAGFLDRGKGDGWDAPFTETFLGRYRNLKNELSAKYPNSDCSIPALAKILQDEMGDLPVNELVSAILVCRSLSPFSEIKTLRVLPDSNTYSDDPIANLEAKRRLFASVGEAPPASLYQ